MPSTGHEDRSSVENPLQTSQHAVQTPTLDICEFPAKNSIFIYLFITKNENLFILCVYFL